jgi:hypothetical protein
MAAAELIWKVWLFWLINGHLAESIRWIAATVEVLDDRDERVMLEGLRGGLDVWLGETSETERQLRDSLPLFERYGRDRDGSLAIAALGLLKANSGEFDHSKALFAQARERLLALGDDWAASIVTNMEGWLAARSGDTRAADEANQLSLELARRSGDPMSTVNALHELAWTALLAGRIDEARRWLTECLPLAHSFDYRLAVAHAFEGFAGIAMAEGHPAVAATLLGAASAGRTAINSTVWMLDGAIIDRITNDARDALGRDAFDEAFDRGLTSSIDDVIELALSS